MKRQPKHVAPIPKGALGSTQLAVYNNPYIDAAYTIVMIRGVIVADIDYVRGTVTMRDWYGTHYARWMRFFVSERRWQLEKGAWEDWQDTDVPHYYLKGMSLSNKDFVGAQVVRRFIDLAWSKFISLTQHTEDV